jgi:hypothetical protein
MKNLKQELNEMKFLFGYRPGKVLSEQNLPTEEGYDMYEGLGMETDMYEMDDDIVMVEPDVMEPEVKPDTDRDVEERPSRPGRPDRDPSRLPYTDPDTHPQGESDNEIEYELEIDDEPRDEVEYELEIDDEPRRPMRSMGRIGSMDDEVNEPFVDDVDSEYENSDLADLVKKYLSKRG